MMLINNVSVYYFNKSSYNKFIIIIMRPSILWCSYPACMSFMSTCSCVLTHSVLNHFELYNRDNIFNDNDCGPCNCIQLIMYN